MTDSPRGASKPQLTSSPSINSSSASPQKPRLPPPLPPSHKKPLPPPENNSSSSSSNNANVVVVNVPQTQPQTQTQSWPVHPMHTVIQVAGLGKYPNWSISMEIDVDAPSQQIAYIAAKGMLMEHTRLAVENMAKAIAHETRNANRGEIGKAVEALHYRMFEAYFCWCEKHFFHPYDTGNKYAEVVLLRVMQSISEHILHCPERLAQVLHATLHQYSQANNTGPMVIRLADLQMGLQRVHRCEGDWLNFDDINQCGSMNTQRQRKAWHESAGVIVLLDILRLYYPIVFVKAWVFAGVLYLQDRIVHKEPLFEGLQYWQTVAHIDSYTYLAVELVLYIYSFWVQERGQSWNRRSWQRLVGLILAILSFLWANIPVLTPFPTTDTVALVSYFFIGRLFMFAIYLPVVERWLGRDRNFVKYGRPRWARRERMKESQEADSKVDKQGVRRVESVITTRASQLHSRAEDEDEEDTPESSTCGCFKYLCCMPFKRMGYVNLQAVAFWLVVFILTWILETIMVAPIGLGYRFEPLCRGACPDTLTFFDINWITSPSKCCACGAGLAGIYTIIALASLIDLYLIFNFVLSIFGFFKGLSRGVAGLLIPPSKFTGRLWRNTNHLLPNPESRSALRQITGSEQHSLDGEQPPHSNGADKDAEEGKESDEDEEEAEERGGKGSNDIKSVNSFVSRSPAHRKEIAKNQSGTRLALINLFGSWEHAMSAWSKICHSLYVRDLISLEESAQLTACFNPPRGPVNKEMELMELLAQMTAEAKERVLFFLKTAKVLGKSPENMKAWRKTPYTEREFLDGVPSLSQVLTTYSEDILKSKEFLREITGPRTNLEHLVSKHPDEWRLFEQRMVALGLFQRSDPDGFRREPLLDTFLDPVEKLPEELVIEVRIWASFRAQTVARTIRGAFVYHEALQTRLKWAQNDVSLKPNLPDMVLGDMVELIIAAQTYGQKPNAESDVRRADLELLMHRWQDYPCAIVFDWDRSGCNPVDTNDIIAFWTSRNGGEGFPFSYATCVKSMQNGRLELTNVLPRLFPLRLGKDSLRTQGKAANHLNAARKLWGHVTQVLDANMDGFIGEGFKLPFITHQFLGRENCGKLRNTNRKTVRHRIIGFREYIFTHPLGGVAAVMASSEFTFGTIYQRTLDDPLGVRMHYGHPDFFDTFWILNRGGPSKASPQINLSEDIFAGYNAWLRNEDTSHVDTLEWQKGRETLFTTASMFLSKISGGAVGMMRTRDMMDMHAGLGIMNRFSLFSGGAGYYLSMVVLSISLTMYTIVFFLLALANANDRDILLLDSTLSVEWVVGFGLATSLPFLAEQLLERGFMGFLHWAREWPVATLFYLFQNQTVAAAVEEGLVTGEAEYINTGRPEFFNPYTKELAYRLYVRSHYYPALTIIWLYSYRLVERGLPGDHNDVPLLVVLLIVNLWLISPVLFCPQTTSPMVAIKDWKQTVTFIFSLKDSGKKAEESLYSFWKLRHRTEHAMDKLAPRLTRFLSLVIQVCVLMAMDDNSMDHYWPFIIITFAYLLFTIIWKLTCKFITFTVVWMMAPIAAALILPALPFKSIQFGQLKILLIGAAGGWEPRSLLRAVIFIYWVRGILSLILLLLSFIFNKIASTPPGGGPSAPRRRCSKDSVSSIYQGMMDVFYLVGLFYHIHLYMALLVMLYQAVVHGLLIIANAIIQHIILPLFRSIGLLRPRNRYMYLDQSNTALNNFYDPSTDPTMSLQAPLMGRHDS